MVSEKVHIIAPLFDQMLTRWRVSDSGARPFGSPCFDVRSIPCHFADPILSHSGGLGINVECRFPFGWNWNRRQPLGNGWNASVGNFDFDERWTPPG
jgi:hypothetical protein